MKMDNRKIQGHLLSKLRSIFEIGILTTKCQPPSHDQKKPCHFTEIHSSTINQDKQEQ